MSSSGSGLPDPRIHPCQRTYSVFTNTHISTTVRTYCPYMPLANGDRDHLCFSSLPLPLSLPLSLSLCIFLFIFTALFEVVITLHVSFDALMNRLFACDALENGNYDSLSLSPTFLCTLSPVALLHGPHFHLLLFSSPQPVILLFCLFSFSLQIIVSLKYCLPRDLCLRLVFPLSPTHSFFSSLYIIIIAFLDIASLYSFYYSVYPNVKPSPSLLRLQVCARGLCFSNCVRSVRENVQNVTRCLSLYVRELVLISGK